MKQLLILMLIAVSIPAAAAQHDSEIINFVRYSPTFSSSGQPTAAQLEALRDAGLQRVIYIAYSDHKRSLENEDRIAKKLGLEYIQIPVEWSAPSKTDFELFASIVRQDPDKSTLLHCQMNFRATAFAMLLRIIDEGVPVAQAKAEMNAVWSPNATWTQFIIGVLQDADIDPFCEGCDWSPAKPTH